MTRRPARLLHRTLGVTEVTAGGVGIIIGAGIYVLLGAATALAGPVVWLAFLLAAVLSLLPIQGLGSVAVMMSQLPRRAIALGTAFCVLGLATGWLLRFRSRATPRRS